MSVDIQNTQPQSNAAPTETSTQVTPEISKDDKTAAKLQLLISREKHARAIEQRVKSMEAALIAKETSFADRERRLLEFENLKRDNPLKALEMTGLSVNDLNQAYLAGEVTPDIKIKRVQSELEEFKERQRLADEERLKAQQAHYEAQESQTINDFKQEIADFVGANKDAYAYIDFENASVEIFNAIDEHYNKTIDPTTGRGKIMSIEEGAKLVEEKLSQKYAKLKEVKKFMGDLNPVPQTTVAKDFVAAIKSQTQSPVQKPRTLSNTQPNPVRRTSQVLTDDQRIAKAIAYAKSLRP